MNEITRRKLQSRLIHQYLKENSYEYKYLFRDEDYIQEIERKAKEYYHVRMIDKIDRLGDKIQLLQTIIDVMK